MLNTKSFPPISILLFVVLNNTRKAKLFCADRREAYHQQSHLLQSYISTKSMATPPERFMNKCLASITSICDKGTLMRLTDPPLVIY